MPDQAHRCFRAVALFHPDLVEGELAILVELLLGRDPLGGLVVVDLDGSVACADEAVDDALANNPDIADKIRGGKVAAAGKIVGDVMKATRGQADPARVKELVLAACS